MASPIGASLVDTLIQEWFSLMGSLDATAVGTVSISGRFHNSGFTAALFAARAECGTKV